MYTYINMYTYIYRERECTECPKVSHTITQDSPGDRRENTKFPVGNISNFMTSEALLFLDVCLFNKTSMASNNSGACNHSVYESSKGSAFFVAVNTQIQFFTGQFYLNKCQCLKHLFYCRFT